MPAANTGDVPITFAKVVDTCWSVTGDWHVGGAVPIVVAWITVVSGAVLSELVDWPSLHAASVSTPIIDSRPTTCTEMRLVPHVADTRPDCPVRRVIARVKGF
jgi:hypothetical protein